jgi:hypothetical protein
MSTYILAIASFVVTVVSWFVQSHLNRKNEIAKTSLKYRLELLTKTLNSIMEVYKILAKNNGSPNPPTKEEQNYVRKSFASISDDLYILGTKKEQKIWKSIENDYIKNIIKSEALITFATLIKDNYRRTLGL